jgi:hypothetical protein
MGDVGQPAAPPKQSGPIVAGLKSGVLDLGSQIAAAAQGLGSVGDSPTLERLGKTASDYLLQKSQTVGRPDLDIAPWREGGAHVVPWLEYQSAKMLPTLAGFLGASALTPEVAVPAAISKAAPTVAKFVSRLPGFEAFGAPTGFGAMVQAADQKPGGLTVDDAKQAALLAPVYGAINAVEPGALKALSESGMAGGLAKRLATGGFVGAALGVPMAGAQTAITDSFRPELTPQERLNNVVDAAVTGGAVGGLMGGAVSGIYGGVRGVRHAEPNTITTEDLTSAVDQALALPPPTAFTDAAGRTVIGAGGDAALRATPHDIPASPDVEIPQAMPSLFGPSAVTDRGVVDNSTIVVGRRGDDGRFTSQPTGVEQPAVDDTSRSFRNWTTPELQSGINALLDKHEAGNLDPRYRPFIQQMQEELGFRQSVNNPSNETKVSTQAEAVEPIQRSVSGDAAETTGAPASTFKIADFKRLFGRNQDLSKIEAADEGELRSKLVDLYLNEAENRKDVRKSTVKALQSQGLLDGNEQPTPLFEAEEARKKGPGGGAPVDKDFQAEWKDAIKGSRDKALAALDIPANREEAQRVLFNALGEPRDVAIRDSEAAGEKSLEGLAKKYDVLDENGNLTETALNIARSEPISMQEAVEAAGKQGYTGAAASMFDRGVQDFTKSAETKKFGSVEERDAYAAGRAWAEERNTPPVIDEAKSQDIMRRRSTAAASGVVPEEALAQKAANDAVDSAGLQSAKHESDIAALKAMVRSGDTEGAMMALERVKKGESLFEQPERAPSEPFKGERIDATSRALRETEGRVKSELSLDREMASRAKTVTREDANAAIRHYELTQAVENAHAKGAIESRDRINLINKLREGKFGEVEKALPFVEYDPRRSPEVTRKIAERRATINDLQDALRQAMAEAEVPELSVGKDGVLRDAQVKLARRDFLAGLAATAAAGLHSPVEAAIKFTAAPKPLADLIHNGGQDMNHARPILEHLKANSSDPAYRMIAAKLLRGDPSAWDHVVIGLWPNSEEARGVTTLNDDGSSTIQIMGKDGMNEQTILHELIHAFVQQRWAKLSAYLPENKALIGDKVERHDQLVEQFRGMWRQLERALEKSSPGIIDRELWAQAMTENADEMLSWSLTNPDAQAYLKSIDLEGNKLAPVKSASQKSFWDHIVDFFRDLFGIKAPRSALDDLMSAGYGLLDAGASVRTGDFNVKLAAEMRRERLEDRQAKTLDTASTINDRVSDNVKKISDIFDHLPFNDSNGRLRQAKLYASDLNSIVEHYKDAFEIDGRNGLVEFQRVQQDRRGIEMQASKPLSHINDLATELKRDPKAREKFSQLANVSTEIGIDPDRSWDRQSDAVKERAKTNPELKSVHAEMRQLRNDMERAGYGDVWRQMRAEGESQLMSQMALKLHLLVTTDPKGAALPGFEVDPGSALLEHGTTRDLDSIGTRDFWREQLNAKLNSLDNYIRSEEARRDQATTKDSDAREIDKRLDPLISALAETRSNLARMGESPYFSLGRDGDYFVEFEARKIKDAVDPKAVAAIAAKLRADGFTGIQITPETNQARMFITVENRDAQDNLIQSLNTLTQQGFIDKDSHYRGTFANDGDFARLAPGWLNRAIENINNNERLTSTQKKSIIEELHSTQLQMLPDNALARVMARRENIPGYNADVFHNFFRRGEIGVKAFANLTTAPRNAQSLADMRAAIREVRSKPFSDEQATSQQHMMQQVADEIGKQAALRGNRGNSPVVAQLTRLTQGWYLGASIPYVMLQPLQLMQLTLPKMGSIHGFSKSFGAMASVTPQAMRVIRAMWQEGKAVNADRAADPTVSYAALVKGLNGNKKLAEFVMRVVNRSSIDVGGQIRQTVLAARAEQSGVDRVLHFAAAPGYYSEVASRLITALASYKLDGDSVPMPKRVDNAVRMINNTLMDYSTDEQPRMFGSKGFAGPLTPLMTKFMSYTVRLVGLLYRETYNALSHNVDAETQAQARKFLMGHLAMTSALAGTMGLPMVTAFAAAYDKAKDLFGGDDDQPSDILADYRGFLADMFGKDMAEMLARGVTRGVGVDISSRVGEQDIVPFSKFMNDRRELKDRLKDLAWRTYGAPSSMVAGWFEGANKVLDGDVLGGMAQMMPKVIADSAKAYRMSEDGFVDAQGRKLPIESPSTANVITRLIGYTSSPEAEYSEARMDQASRSTQLNARATQLRNRIADAIERKDFDTARELIPQALEFDRANPQMSVVQGIEGTLRRRATGQAQAQALKTPLGVSPRDLPGIDLTRYANVEYRAQ